MEFRNPSSPALGTSGVSSTTFKRRLCEETKKPPLCRWPAGDDDIADARHAAQGADSGVLASERDY